MMRDLIDLVVSILAILVGAIILTIFGGFFFALVGR